MGQAFASEKAAQTNIGYLRVYLPAVDLFVGRLDQEGGSTAVLTLARPPRMIASAAGATIMNLARSAVHCVLSMV